MEKKIDEYKPSPYFVWSVHLDGDQRDARPFGVRRKASTTRRWRRSSEAKRRGFRVNINCTLFNDADPERVAEFFDTIGPMGVDGITVSPGYAYERAPDQQHFLNRDKTKQLFREIFKRGNNGKNWSFSQSALFLDFLAGNQTYQCTPWGNPTRNVFGWQRPCYLLGEGYAKTFKELMETTEWDKYGTGNYEKCADCMVHCGFEATAVMDTVAHPLKALGVSLRGPRTEGAYREGHADRQAASGGIRVLEATSRSSWKRSAARRTTRAPSRRLRPRTERHLMGGGQVMSLSGRYICPFVWLSDSCFFVDARGLARIDRSYDSRLFERTRRKSTHGSIQRTHQSRQSRSRRLFAARQDVAQARLQRDEGGTGRRGFSACCRRVTGIRARSKI